MGTVVPTDAMKTREVDPTRVPTRAKKHTLGTRQAAMDAFEFLETLPNATLERLYEDPWACQAVFQALPALAQQFVVRLLASESPVPRPVFAQWVHAAPEPPPQLALALERLERLRVFQSVAAAGTLQLHRAFQRQLRRALSSLGGSPWESGRLALGKELDSTGLSALELERYARSRWDSVLHFMVGSTAVKEPPKSVVQILLRTKLMQQSTDKRAYHITDTGYEFMLKDIHVQMWIFMLEYIKTLDHSGALKQEDILQFLFQIRYVCSEKADRFERRTDAQTDPSSCTVRFYMTSYCQTSEFYATGDLTATQQLLLEDFIDFGLLYRKRASSDRFYTTSLAVNLIFGGSTGQKRSLLSLTSSFAGVRSVRATVSVSLSSTARV